VSTASSGVETLDTLRSDLVAEQNSLDHIVANLTDTQWATPTASAGWNVADQIAHLSYFDNSGAKAIRDANEFHASIADLVKGSRELGFDGFTLSSYRSLSPTQLLETWREGRVTLSDAAAGLNETDRVPWYGPSMSAKSFLSARLMETWAHGTDVADALGVALPATDRLRHVARLGFITRKWSYDVRSQVAPHGDVRVELLSPTGAIWSWGRDDAEDAVTGSAEEFCLVVTQRRHVDDTSLTSGELGRHWLERAQAFAGGPTIGPSPRSER
jgi:uncharacterized protein (TIGR03084 family)